MRKLFNFVLATMLVSTPTLLFSQEPVLTLSPATPKQSDNGSYLVGFNVGTELSQNGFNEKDFVGEAFLNGLMEALMKKKPSLSNEEIKAAGTAINTKLQARAAETAKQQAVIGQTNLEKSQAFLAANAKKDGVQTLKSGLQYIVMKKGQGKSPSLTSVVRVHYEGKLMSGEIFDATSKHPGGNPAEFPVGKVIKGWTEALQRMAIGDKWQLFIPPDLAYGPDGPESIGPNQALIFEVELLEIVN